MSDAAQAAAQKGDWRHAAAVAAALFVLYAATSPRGVALEDDGLFILSSYFLGIEHPPGFPLHTLLGKLFTLLPFGSVAYRVHLLSALFGALTCGLLWMCARRLTEGRLPAYLAALAPRVQAPELVVGLDSGCGNYEQLWGTTSLRGELA